MFFQHVYEKGLAQASYVIGCQKGGVAAVIDPKRDVDTYLEIAKANNLKITQIYETHIHADFLSGSRELAALTGAKLYLSDEGDESWKYEFPHVPLKHGDRIELGNLTFEVLHTPGHTPESISFLLTDHPATDSPVMFFTGDFVFVGDVGRPDLLEKAAGVKGTQQIGAEQMYDSLLEFAKIPEYVQVWPGHGAGSACGKALGAVPSSTVGYEKIRNWALQMLSDKSAFIDYLLDGQPEPPKYFAMMKKLNKTDRPLLTSVPEVPRLSNEVLQKEFAGGTMIVDTRNKLEFAKAFVPGSINIQHNSAFSTWAGWMIGYDQPFILVLPENEIEDVTRKLMRIGLDNIKGFVTPEQLLSAFAGQLDQYTPIEIQEFNTRLGAEAELQVVDVRGASEFKEGHIEGAIHVFVGTLGDNLAQIDREKPIVVHCKSGDRAAIAYSLLRKEGFDKVDVYLAGMNEWQGQGYPVVTDELVNMI
ncbi:MAG: MBL fold metallo-hydrolase [Saprospiraceae bacterium]|nr:MBL fold metallo-hydrolase [Lewinella sp.]